MRRAGRVWSLLALSATISVGCSKPQNGEANSSPAPQSQQEPDRVAQPPPPEPSPAERALEQVLESGDTLPQAIETLRPMMTDTHGEAMDPGAVILAIWAASKNVKWEDLQAIPATKYGLVMKDPDSERGKRLCARGSIVQIQVERTEYGKLFHGVFATSRYQFIRYSVVGSTGELIEGSRAKLCGVVTGLSSYPNVQGGITHSVYVVGMFDLPVNHRVPGD